MNATTTVTLGDLTAELTCNLCHGYLIDATTIIECLHSFCKSCIVNHLESSEYCPVCDVQLQPSRPLESVRSDKVLQEMVYKLVPGLYAREMARRRKYYDAHPEKTPATVEEVKQNCYITSNDDMQISLEPLVANDPNEEVGRTLRRYIKCKAGATICVVKRFIVQKYDLHRKPVLIDVMYGDRLIPDDFLLMDVAYKYSWNQKNETHLPLKYKVHGDPKYFEAKAPELISSEGALGALKRLKVQSKMNVNGIVKKKSNGLVSVRSKKILQESVRSQLVLNESQQLVELGKLALQARMPKKGRPPKCKQDGLNTLKQQKLQNGSPQAQPKEVQLSISEKGVMSATVPVTSAHSLLNCKAGDGPSSFPRVDSTVLSSLQSLARSKPESSMSSKSVWQPLQQNELRMPQVPQEMTVRTTTWHPKIPKGIIISQQDQELATKALKKKTSTNMETLKGVNRKLQDKLPDHYYKADIVPLRSPPTKTNGIKPKNGANGKISPSKRQGPFSVGEVRFTPVIAKKLLSSPGSRLNDSPKKHKIFKSRQQESSIPAKPAANPVLPPLDDFEEEPEELPDLGPIAPSFQSPPVATLEPPASVPFVTLPTQQATVSIPMSSANGLPYLANNFNPQLFNPHRQNFSGLPNFGSYDQSSIISSDILRSLSYFKLAQFQQQQPPFLSQLLTQTNISGLPVFTPSSLQTTVASHGTGMNHNHTTCHTQPPVHHSPNKRTMQTVLTNGHHGTDVSTFSDQSLAESERRVSDDLARLTAMVTTVSEAEVPSKRRKSSSPSKLRRLLTAPRTPPKQKVNGLQAQDTTQVTATTEASPSTEDTPVTNGGFYVRTKAPAPISTDDDDAVHAPVNEVSEEPPALTETDMMPEEDETNSEDIIDQETEQLQQPEQLDEIPPATEEIAEQTEGLPIETDTEAIENDATETEIILEKGDTATEDQLDVVTETASNEQEEHNQESPSPTTVDEECDDDDDNVLHIVEDKAERDQNEESSPAQAVDDTAEEYLETPLSIAPIEDEVELPADEEVEQIIDEVENNDEEHDLTEAQIEDDLIHSNTNNNEIVIEQSLATKEPAISPPDEASICQTPEPDATTSTATSA